MVGLSSGTFRCVVQTPHGCLLDCKSGLVVLPAHDGMRGILRNHAPMLCRLARGIVEVKEIAGRKDAFFLVNGGFAGISENSGHHCRFLQLIAHFLSFANCSGKRSDSQAMLL